MRHVVLYAEELVLGCEVRQGDARQEEEIKVFGREYREQGEAWIDGRGGWTERGGGGRVEGQARGRRMREKFGEGSLRGFVGWREIDIGGSRAGLRRVVLRHVGGGWQDTHPEFERLSDERDHRCLG